MKTVRTLILAGAAILLAQACNQQKVKILKQSDFPAPPVAQIIPSQFSEFGNQRVDNYFWLKDKTDPKVIEYLNAENRYTDTVMASTKELQNKIYKEIIGRIKESDESYPQLSNGYLYYSRTIEGKQYREYCRKADSKDAAEEIIFDCNKMAEGKKAFLFNDYDISDNNRYALYLYNETGSYAESILKVRDLSTGEDLSIEIPQVSSAAWAADNKSILYTTIDESLRPYQLYKIDIENNKISKPLYTEDDGRFSIWVSRSKAKDLIFVGSASSTTTEYRYLSASDPGEELKVFIPRKQGVEYYVSQHSQKFFIRYKDKEHLNGMIYEAPLKGFEDISTWKVVVDHDPLVKIDGYDIFRDFLAIQTRRDGLNEIKIISLTNSDTKLISFPEPVYTASLRGNPEFEASTIRYNYTSLNRPSTLFEYDMTTGESTKLKEQEVPSGFNPDDYIVERIWADAPDGVKVPMAIVYKRGLKRDGSNPALLYSYGSYGSSSDVYFSPVYYSLIDRGYVFGIAQIRGGSDLGEQWYEDGKLLKKMNTFTDFIACSQKLIEDRYTSPERLAAMGGSAGGLLMGAVVNLRPDLYNAIIAEVPFVDVINTMLDSTLPLTTQEYEEWGNPNEEEYYNYMLSYSPYDNVKAQDYPNILATGGLNDSQVGFHEPAKWVAKLRANKTDNNIVLLYTNMDSGHGGATGRYDSIKEIAFQWAFLLNFN